MTFIICTVICCITIIICKLIQANSYSNALEQERRLYSTEILDEEYGGKPSPYSLERNMHSATQQWGYVVTKNGDKIKSSSGHYQILQLHDARDLMNELERIEGYKQTKI